MTCDEIEARGIAEEYLHHRLTGEAREGYERHFFDCDPCFARLETLRATRSALRHPAAAPRQSLSPLRWLAAAAMLVAGLFGALWLTRSREAPPSSRSTTSAASSPTGQKPPSDGSADEIRRLARFDAPPYTPPQLRSPSLDNDFEAAMRRYASRDYRGAIPLLESAQRGVNGEAARFFLGISLLLDGRADEGIRVLDTLGADSRSALAEDARFYSARGHLLRGDPSSAIRALDRTIELHGDREREARSLRDEIVRIGPKG